MRFKGEILFDYLLFPFQWLLDNYGHIAIVSALCAIIMYVVMFTIAFGLLITFLGGLTVFPFWMLGQIDLVRSGSSDMAIIQVLLVVGYYCFAIPFTIWFFSSE